MTRLWDPDYPRRHCYTCDRPPDGHFPDASPSYRCSHPPVTYPPGLPGVTLVTFRHTATRDEMVEAYETALRWQELDAGLKGKEWEPKPPWTQLTTDWRSIMGEIATAAITGLPRRTRLMVRGDRRRGMLKPHDIGQRTEVRLPQAKGRGFRFTKKDLQPGRLGILVYDDLFRPYELTDLPSFRLVGWVDINDASLGQRYVSRWDTPTKREWLVPASDLEPMTSLPSDA